MWDELEIKRVAASRISEVDFDALGFGDIFCDHMFSLRYRDGAWTQPQILPYGPISVCPGNATLHYGQSVFEGLKAFMGADGQVRVFRPDMNAQRLLRSCERLCIPPPDPALFCAAIDELLRLDHAWIPRRRGQACYIRPLIFSDENHLEVRPSTRFRLIVMTSPVRAYFDQNVKPIGLKVEQRYTRAAPGGMGAAKTAGNYAASLFPTQQGAQEGYVQVVWLDALEHRYVEEVGAMNIFFRFGERLVTPALRGTILPGVTRDSAITLLREAGHEVEERRIAMSEIGDGVRSGELREAFGAGTAAIIAPIGAFLYDGEVLQPHHHEQAGPVAGWLYDQLTGVQLGEIEDRHGWNRLVEIDLATAAQAR